MKKTLVIIPARKNSNRLKSKNFLKLGNLPLIEHTILKASKLDSKFFRVVVSSDDSRAFNITKKYSNIKFIRRPDKISLDQSTASSYVEHTLNTINYFGLVAIILIILYFTDNFYLKIFVIYLLLTLIISISIKPLNNSQYSHWCFFGIGLPLIKLIIS